MKLNVVLVLCYIFLGVLYSMALEVKHSMVMSFSSADFVKIENDGRKTESEHNYRRSIRCTGFIMNAG